MKRYKIVWERYTGIGKNQSVVPGRMITEDEQGALSLKAAIEADKNYRLISFEVL